MEIAHSLSMKGHLIKLDDYKEPGEKKVTLEPSRPTRSELYRQDFKEVYRTWKAKLMSSTKPPNEKQAQVLNLVHKRCLLEHEEECKQKINQDPSQAPLFRLIHGFIKE